MPGVSPLDGTYVVFDLETTGFSPIQDKIIEIGAVKVERGVITERFSTFVNPKIPIPFKITQLTSITDDMVVDAETIDVVLPKFLDFIGDAVLVAHNAGFDVSFIEQNCRYQEIEREFISLDTVALARVLLPTLSKYKLNVVAKALNISLENHHRAVDDAGATAEIFVRFVEMLKEREIDTLKELNQFGSMNPDAIRKLPSHHAVILAKNRDRTCESVSSGFHVPSPVFFPGCQGFRRANSCGTGKGLSSEAPVRRESCFRQY